MAVRKVLQATEPRGEAILRRRAHKVRVFDGTLKRLLDDMVETMRAHRGVGLAAPQIGQLLRVIVAELPVVEGEEEEKDRPRRPGKVFQMCNPEIVWSSEESEVAEEGCLSLAGWYGQVPRAVEVEVRYQDAAGHRRKLRARGYLARILQHEVDHLDGILFTDRVQDLSTLVRITDHGTEPAPVAEIAAAQHDARAALR